MPLQHVTSQDRPPYKQFLHQYLNWLLLFSNPCAHVKSIFRLLLNRPFVSSTIPLIETLSRISHKSFWPPTANILGCLRRSMTNGSFSSIFFISLNNLESLNFPIISRSISLFVISSCFAKEP